MKTLTRLGGLVACLSLVTAPASAAEGWITDGDGGLHHLDTATGTASMVGLMPQAVSALAATAPSTMLGLQEVPGDGQHLVAVDVVTATTSDRGQLAPGFVFAALTSTADGTVYAAAEDSDHSQLFVVTPDDASLTPVGDPQARPGLQALAGACGGDLLGVDANDNLVRVDRVTGAVLIIGHPTTGPGEFVQALAFDHQSRTLWALTNGPNGEHLLAVDPATGAATQTPYQSGQVGSAPLGLAFDTPASCSYERRLSALYHARTERFTGRLVGSWQPCTAGQKVRVYRRVPGPDRRIGSTTTRSDGRWALSVAKGRGPVYAEAPASHHPVTGSCLPARSGLIR